MSLPRLLIAALLLSLSAMADSVFDHPLPEQPADGQAFAEALDQLQDVEVLRADFRQRKQIEALSRPLISSGTILFASERGVYWQTQTPFPAVSLILPGEIRQRNDDGTWRVTTAGDQPMIRTFTDLFLATFSGDASQLRDHFELFFSGDKRAWQLGLKPRDSQLQKAIRHIIVSGGENLDSVTIVETNGDSTTIELTSLTTEPPDLTPEEAATFEVP